MRLRTPIALVAGLAATAMAAPVATADPRPAPSETIAFAAVNDVSAEEASASYLARQLAASGGKFDFEGTTIPDWGLTADAILALDAAGVAQTQAAASTNALAANVTDYVTGEAFGDTGSKYAGAYAKTLIVAQAQKADTGNFGGVDLLTGLRSLETASGRFSDVSSFGDNSNGFGQTLSLIALKRAGIAPSAASLGFLAASQCADGGFRLFYDGTPCTSDPDVTSLAVQALIVTGGVPDAAANRGLDYLVSRQGPDGGVGGGTLTEPANANSTGLAGQAFLAGGRRAQARKANAFIAGLQYDCTFPDALVGGVAYNGAALADQRADGAVATTRDQDRRSTAQASLALSGTPLYAVTATGADAATPTVTCPPRSAGTFTALAPSRLVDTRTGTKVAANGTINVQATGRGGVPAVSGVDSVVVNVTAVSPTATGSATVWPQGTTRPASSSNLSFRGGVAATAGLSVVKVGATGGISVFNGSSGTTHYLVDVVGYYRTSGQTAAARFTPVAPKRILDTRPGAPIGANAERALTVRGGTTGVPATATGVVLNVTAVGQTAASYLSVYPAGQARPTASNINWPGPGAATPNLVYARVGTNGQVRLYNQTGNVDVLVDVVGWFGPTGDYVYQSVTPKRVLDTRSPAVGVPTPGAIGAGATVTVDTTGDAAGVPETAKVTVLNTMVTATTGSSYLTVWPAGTTRPVVSNLNWRAGTTVSNVVSAKVGAAGAVSVYNSTGTADVVMDVTGWYGG